MTGIKNIVNMKPVNTLHVIETPNERFIYVGQVPVEIGYVDPTPEKLEAAKFGARFGPKTRSFESRVDAVKFAKSHGYEVEYTMQEIKQMDAMFDAGIGYGN